MFDHDDDGKLTFDELVDTKKALDTLTSFSEKVGTRGGGTGSMLVDATLY